MRLSQRRAPFTSRPMPGIRTRTSSTIPARKNQGALVCQKRTGTMKVSVAAKSASARKMLCRMR